MMQAASDIFLGYTQDEDTGRQFYVRTLKNRRFGGVSEISEAEALSGYAQLCGRTLARAHARSGDPAAMAGYMGKSEALDDAIASFAMAYADQTMVDHAALVKAKARSRGASRREAKPRRADAPDLRRNSWRVNSCVIDTSNIDVRCIPFQGDEFPRWQSSSPGTKRNRAGWNAMNRGIEF